MELNITELMDSYSSADIAGEEYYHRKTVRAMLKEVEKILKNEKK